MAGRNIEYRSPEIEEFYASNRQTWAEFYPSERWVLEEIARGRESLGDVLDVGCACGGLGAALCERFRLGSYTGMDVHAGAIARAKRERALPVPARFVQGDILDLPVEVGYDLVVALGCADWNIESAAIVSACWNQVRVGGRLVLSLRLTPGEGVNDIGRSFQKIDFSGREGTPEIANYVVFGFRQALALLGGLRPAPLSIGAYGYWGPPSRTAVTPFARLVFSVFWVTKPAPGDAAGSPVSSLHLPIETFLGVDSCSG